MPLIVPPAPTPTDARPEPFLRWAGGKRRLLSTIHKFLPHNMTSGSFYEPFVGGGAVMFSLHQTHPTQPRIIINDINTELIITYLALRDEYPTVIKHLTELQDKNTEEHYYRIRETNPTTNAERAAKLIYLNRTGFNGLYRVNGKGQFNVPYGKLKNPNICNTPLLQAVNSWLQRVEIHNTTYTQAVQTAKPGDTVYFDPPYIPLSITSSFSKYSKDDFLIHDQRALAETIKQLTKNNVRVILSNSFTPTTIEIFGDALQLKTVTVTRSISAKKESRGSIQEIIGINYPANETTDPTSVKTYPNAN